MERIKIFHTFIKHENIKAILVRAQIKQSVIIHVSYYNNLNGGGSICFQ